MVIYGGTSGSLYRNDAWGLSLATLTWSRLASSGTSLPIGCDYSAVYDPTGHRMIVFGGQAWPIVQQFQRRSVGVPPGFAQSWSCYDLGRRPRRSARRHTAIYDSAGQRMVVFGGENADGSGQRVLLDDVWALSLNGVPAWTRSSRSTPTRSRTTLPSIMHPVTR